MVNHVHFYSTLYPTFSKFILKFQQKKTLYNTSSDVKFQYS